MLLQKIATDTFEFINGVWGVSIESFNGQKITVGHKPHELFPAASVIKIPVLVELFYQVCNGKINIKTEKRVSCQFKTSGSGVLQNLSEKLVLTFHDLAILMIQYSDNMAANILIDTLGRENINRSMENLGLLDTVLKMERIDPEVVVDKPAALATTTPADMANLFLRLAQEDILSPAACREILKILQRSANKNRICGKLPFRPDIVVSHKTGTLNGVYNDVGLVRFSGGAYVISIFSEGIQASEDPRQPNEAEQAIANFSREVFDYFDQGRGDVCHA